MKHGNFLALKAAISLVYGLAFILMPVTIWGLYDMAIDPAGIFLSRFAGGFVIGVALICWYGRTAEDHARQGITLSLFIGDIFVTLAILLAQLSGLWNALGWTNVAIVVFLTGGLGYFRFLKPNAS